MAFGCLLPRLSSSSAGSMLQLHGTAGAGAGGGGAPAAATDSHLSLMLTPRRRFTVVVRVVVATPGGGTGGTAALALARRRRRSCCCAYTGDQWSPAGNYEKFDRHMRRFRHAYGVTPRLKEYKEDAFLQELEATGITAKKCLKLLGGMVNYAVSDFPEEEVYRIGESFVEVEMQCNNGFVRPISIEVAMEGLMRMVEIFSVAGRGDTWSLVDYVRQSTNTDDAYIKELVKCFQELFDEVRKRYVKDRSWYSEYEARTE